MLFLWLESLAIGVRIKRMNLGFVYFHEFKVIEARFILARRNFWLERRRKMMVFLLPIMGSFSYFDGFSLLWRKTPLIMDVFFKWLLRQVAGFKL